MSQAATAAQTKSNAAVTEAIRLAKDQLAKAQVQVTQLEARAGELALRQQSAAPAERQQLAKEWASATADLQLAHIERQRIERRLNTLLDQEEIGERSNLVVSPPAPPAPVAGVIVEPPRNDFFSPEQAMQIMSGGALLLFPFVIVLARQLWIRGTRRPALDPEQSPRLQRIEEAVEAIALEVERIGEAQRFTTKLLAERPADAVPAIPAPRREPGTITPH